MNVNVHSRSPREVEPNFSSVHGSQKSSANRKEPNFGHTSGDGKWALVGIGPDTSELDTGGSLIICMQGGALNIKILNFFLTCRAAQ